MLRLLKLEFTKLWATRYFRVLGILWLVAWLAIPVGFKIFLNFLESNINDWPLNISPSQLPIFDFVDIWQNLAYAYKMITIFICFSVIISITNEFDYKTIRQNVIDGLSKRELWLSKILLIFSLSVLSTFFLLILGLITGYTSSPVTGFSYVVKNIEFVGAYFLHVFYFLSFCLVLATLIKRAGFTIALLLFWTYIIEPILSAFMYYNWDLKLWANALPMEAGWMLIHRPMQYFLKPSQDYVAAQDLIIAGLWLTLFLWGSYRLLAKRDL